ncbi:MAG: tetratricopeptide repeat protein [Planctomycetota bacterium]
MNLAGWRFLLFAVVGAAAIVLLASIGVPTPDRESVDKYTGQTTRNVETVADAFHDARATGDAQLALELLEKRAEHFPDNLVIRRVRAVLLAEFLGPDEPVHDDHPDARTLEAERARARDVRAELTRRISEKLPPEPALALLVSLEADEAQAQAVESFFAPLARLHQAAPIGRAGADEKAARAELSGSYLPLARAFGTRGRARAKRRWLLRAYAAGHPAFEPLYAAYLEHGRVAEAFLLLGAQLSLDPDNVEHWRRRATLAGWLTLPRAEAEAQRIVLEHDGDDATRRRLIDLYTYVGRPGDAVPHAVHLTRDSRDKKELEWPVRLALSGGDIDRALALLTDLAENSDDEPHWRERIIAYAWQDMRVERVVTEYRRLVDRFPDRGYQKELESVLRRTNRREELVRLLEGRLEQDPGNRALEDEVLGLHIALGNQASVKALVKGRIERETDPARFFRELETYRLLGIGGLVDHGHTMAGSPNLGADDVRPVLVILGGLGDEWQPVATAVARRFINHAASREYLIAHIDASATDAERARAAGLLAADFPEDRELLRAWIERAGWAGAADAEVAGRERWLSIEPDDTDNRRKLADIYNTLERHDKAAEQWTYFVEKEGVRSDSTMRLIDTLFAAGRVEDAVAWLERRANLPDATIEEQLTAADQLFGTQHLDRSLRFYMAVLDEQPDHQTSLLRVGQIRSWTNDPRGAIPFLERRLELSEEQAASVRFYLGEAHWATRDPVAALAYHTRALAELTDATREHRLMRAKILTRLDRVDEAEPIFRQELAKDPGSVDLILDYADAMVGAQRTKRARDLADAALARAPRKARVMRTDGTVALLERRYEDAARILGDARKTHGPNAGSESERARALELSGQFEAAHAAYQDALALQPESRDTEQSLLRTWDRIARILHANAQVRITGDDHVLRAWGAGSLRLGEATRLGAGLGIADYSGRAAAVDNGNTDVEETVATLSVAVNHRLKRLTTLSAGLEAYVGAPGNLPVGGWIDIVAPSYDPYRLLGARLHFNRLFDDPTASVALGGRSSGLEFVAQGDLGGRWWGLFSADLRYISLTELDAADPRVRAAATVGYRLVEGEARVGEKLELDHSTLPGLLGPDVRGDPALTRGPLVSVWATAQLIRLLGERELAQLIPIGEAFNYISVGSRADFHLAPGLGAKIEGSAGYELLASEPFFELGTGLTYRPTDHLEFTFLANYGRAFGRADNANTFDVRFHLSYRW